MGVGLMRAVKMREMAFHHSLIGGKNQGEEEVDQGVVDVGKTPHQMTNSLRKVSQLAHRLASLHNDSIMN